MGYARGLEILTVDSRGRIAACRIIKKYLRSEKGAVVTMKDDAPEEELSCYIGFTNDSSLPVLILVNEKYADRFSETSEDIEGLMKVASQESEIIITKKVFHKLFRPVDMKTNKIQLNASEIKKLKITDENRQVVIDGDGDRFLIWPLDEYKRRFPTFYQRIDSSESETQ